MSDKRIEHFHDLLPGLELATGALHPQQLEDLFACADWRIVLWDHAGQRRYGKYPLISMYKTLALPFCLPIPSERFLSRLMSENQFLQVICGIQPNSLASPSKFRHALWHLRQKYYRTYPTTMLSALIMLAIAGFDQNLSIPFARRIDEIRESSEAPSVTLELDSHRYPIEIWRPQTSTRLHNSAEPLDVTAYFRLIRQLDFRKSIVDDIQLPVEVYTRLRHGRSIRFRLDRPDWFDSALPRTKIIADLDGVRDTPYTACHVLVTRTYKNEMQLLLSKKRVGYAAGMFVLPGGKKLPAETIQECATRELREETGLELLRSKPVSLYSAHMPGRPNVLSAAALGLEYRGSIREMEPDQHTQWAWYAIDDLPQPLFDPARIAIDHYRLGTFAQLQWDDVESQTSITQPMSLQIRLDLPT
jgi:8-oxo-dGTP diphosphatase